MSSAGGDEHGADLSAVVVDGVIRERKGREADGDNDDVEVMKGERGVDLGESDFFYSKIPIISPGVSKLPSS